MRVLVTGASGFVGSHAVARMVGAGHRVRAFVRSPEKLAGALAFLGSPDVEVATGDVRDPEAVRSATAGCDGVLHAANVYSYDIRHAAEMEAVNVLGTANVIGAAVAAGCERIIHVSSMVAIIPHDGPIPPDPPLGVPSRHRPYTASKIAAEAVARSHQAAGAPVVITYPGAVFGPHDPGSGEMVGLGHAVLGGGAPFGLDGQLGITDAGWLADVHTGLLEGALLRHVAAPGILVGWREFFDRCHELTGRRRPRLLPTPGPLALGVGWLSDRASRALDRRLPVGNERAWVILSWQDADQTSAVEVAGPPPPLDDTLREAISWMASAGHLTVEQAGRLA